MAESQELEQLDIWQFNHALSRRLLGINVVNVWLGRRLMRGQGFWKGVGTQAVSWGVINIGIAVFGTLGTRRKLDSLDDPQDDAAMREQTRSLHRILRINAPLNLLYILGGYLWARRSKYDAYQRGNGWGVVLQGILLLIFDTFHLSRISKMKR